MEVPTPPVPTDNLYKFMALGGLAAVLFMFWFLEPRVSEETKNLETLVGERELLQLETRNLETDATNYFFEVLAMNKELFDFLTSPMPLSSNTVTFTNQLTKLQLDNLRTSLAESVVGRAEKQQAEAQRKMAEFVRRSRDVGITHQQWLNKTALLASSHAHLSQLTKMGQIVCTIAGALSGLGFSLWYSKVQRYQDRMLQKEADDRAPKHKSPHKNEAQGKG